MPKFTLFTDWSVHAPHTLYACTLHKNFAGTQFPTYNFIIPNTLQRNLFFWNYRPSSKDEMSNDIGKLPRFEKIKNRIKKNEDILISSNIFGLVKHKNIVHLLKHDTSLQNYDIQIVIHLGRLDFLYEAQRRSIDGCCEENKKIWDFLEDYTDILLQIIKLYEENFGKEKLQLVWDSSSSFNNTYIPQELSDILGIALPAHIPPHISNFKSCKARKMWKIFSELRATLPTFNLSALAEELKNYEETMSDTDWQDGYVSSKNIRKKIHNKSISFYEEIKRYFPENYSFNFDANIEETISSQEDLTEKDFQLFFDFLDKTILYTLYKNLHYYKRVLNNRHDEFASALHKIMQNESPETKESPRLSVLTLCYNHEKYIAECIESVQAQKTDFPIKHIIVDHASTDKSQEIIASYTEKYPNIVPYFFNAREGGGVNVKTLFKLADTEYVALCDGDDYFTDPLKLQKQVDLLDNNPSATICFHPVQVVYEGEPSKTRIYPPESMLPRGVRPFYYLGDMFKNNLIQTNSVTYRWRFKDELPEWFRPDLVPGDWYWHLLHAENGKIAYINEVMSAYRRHKQSLYKEGEYEDTVKHRLIHGMNELECFDVVSKHFDNKYDSHIFKLTKDVFAHYLQYYLEYKDDSYLKDAVEKYPSFAQFFHSSLLKCKESNAQS